MGCHTWVHKKVTTAQDCKCLIANAMNNAKSMSDFIKETKDEFPDDIKNATKSLEEYWQYVKDGEFIHDPDNVFVYFSDGRWILCNEYTFEDCIDEYDRVMKTCQWALACLDSFEELKDFILKNHRYFGYDFSAPYVNDDLETDEINKKREDSSYGIVRIIDDEIYVHSNDIQHQAFEHTPFFRVYGYPSEAEDIDEIILYKASPAGQPVYGWKNADDLIKFIDWYKTTEKGNKTQPYVYDNENIIEGYGDDLYNAIRKFFEVNKDKDLLIHFG